MTELKIGLVFGRAYEKAASVMNIVSGFKKSGISPFNHNFFTKEDFAAAAVTDCDQLVVSEQSKMCDFLSSVSINTAISHRILHNLMLN